MGIFPEIFVSVRVRPPAAADTWCRLATELTDEDVSVPRLRLTRVSALIFVPPFAPEFPRKPNPAGLPEPAVGDFVTVISVPTPYSACSTLPCAFLTPEDAAVTVITSPIPNARPRAIKMACRIRRRNSRRR